jgi:UDP-N-acetylmuramate dehydrogenase
MIHRNFSLKKYNTFGLDYKADIFQQVKSENDAVNIAREQLSGKQLLVLGGGSNILFTEDFRGTILHVEIGGIAVEGKSGEEVTVSAGAGVNWDDFAGWCVDNGYGGVENLSLIPGTAGATAVQNIGAYGTEVKDIISKVRAVSLRDGSVREFENAECLFAYRNSIFKNELKGQYLITRVYFRLNTGQAFTLGYGSLSEEVDRLGGASLLNIRKAVIEIRRSKLPDPEVTGNAGSFFKNPVIASQMADDLKHSFPAMPVYDDPSGGKKLAAGWLIEQCGLKGKISGNAGVHDKQALVLINRGGATGKEIYDLSEEIRQSVRNRFGVGLEREVEVVGSI